MGWSISYLQPEVSHLCLLLGLHARPVSISISVTMRAGHLQINICTQSWSQVYEGTPVRPDKCLGLFLPELECLESGGVVRQLWRAHRATWAELR